MESGTVIEGQAAARLPAWTTGLTQGDDSMGTVFSRLPVGPGEAVAMLVAVGLVVYSGYYIRTHSRKQIVVAWVAIAAAIVIFLVVLKFLE